MNASTFNYNVINFTFIEKLLISLLKDLFPRVLTSCTENIIRYGNTCGSHVFVGIFPSFDPAFIIKTFNIYYYYYYC